MKPLNFVNLHPRGRRRTKCPGRTALTRLQNVFSKDNDH